LAPLTARIIDVNPDVMVSGGGIAGNSGSFGTCQYRQKSLSRGKKFTIGAIWPSLTKHSHDWIVPPCILDPKNGRRFATQRTFKCSPTVKLTEVKGYCGQL